MNKLYYIVCESKDATLFEGRYQGRTRGAALKFLKEQIGRKSLNGVVFTITEIPVPLIREVVAEMLAEQGSAVADNVVPLEHLDPEPDVAPSDDAAEPPEPASPPAQAPAPSKPKSGDGPKVGNPGHGDEVWTLARAYWEECRNLRETARKFELSPNTVKTRARRENWKGEAK